MKRPRSCCSPIMACALALACLVLAVTTACADVSGIRLHQIAWSCRSGDANTAFLEFEAAAPGQSRDGTLNLEIVNALGMVAADIPIDFGSHTGEPWPAGTTWLLGGSAFAAKAGIAADGPLPNTLQRQAGSVTLYVYDSTGTRLDLDRLEWGSGSGLVRAPYAGQSLVRVDSATYTLQRAPNPTSSSGATAGGGCYGYVPDWNLGLDQLFLACGSGQKGARYISVAARSATTLDPNVQLRLWDFRGNSLSRLSNLFGAKAGTTVAAGTRFLLGSTGFQSATGMAVDRTLTPLPDSLGGTITLVGLNAAGDSATVLDAIVYGLAGAATVTTPSPGLAVQHQPDGSSTTNAPATPRNLAGAVGTGSCLQPNANGLLVRIGEVGFGCRMGTPGLAFIELLSRADQPYDTRIGLRAYNASGALLFDMPAVLANRTGTFTAAKRYLLGSSVFATLTGTSPDGVLAAALDTTGGVLQLYASGSVLHEFRYGAVPGGLALQPPGGSWELDANDVFQPRAAATPTNSSGVSARATPCYTGTPTVTLGIQEFAKSCYYGTPATSYIELSGSGFLDAGFSLEVTAADGHLLYSLPQFTAPLYGTFLSNGGHVLLGGPRFASIVGLTPDVVLPADPDSMGGRIRLVRTDPVTQAITVPSELVYGSAGGPLPPPGGCLRLQNGAGPLGSPGFVAVSTPAPTNRFGVLSNSSACYPYRPSTAVRIREFATRCRDASLSASFISLEFTADQLLDPAIGLRITDHSGKVLTTVEPLYGPDVIRRVSSGQSFLLSNAGASTIGVASDITLPVALDPLGGTLTLYVHPVTSASSTDFASTAYAPNTLIPAPDPGGSLALVGGIGALRDVPTPSNLAGETPGSTCYGVPDAHVLLSEAGFACAGATSGGYVVIATTRSGAAIDDRIGLRLRDAHGALLADVPHVLHALLGRSFSSSGRVLLATTGFSSTNGVTPDVYLPVTPTTDGGTITLYQRDPVTGAETRIHELVYGSAPGGTPAPPPGGALLAAPDLAFHAVDTPTPSGLSSVIAQGACFGYQPPLGLGMHLVGLACRDGSPASYLELRARSAVFADTLVGLRIRDAHGALLSELRDPFGAAAWQSFAPGHSWLLATPEGATALGILADATLPAALDTTGGSIALFVHRGDGSETALDSLSWGAATTLGRVTPGAAIRDGRFTVALPDVHDSAGALATSPCIGTPTVRLHLAQLGFGCASTVTRTAGQFVEVANDDPRATLPYGVDFTSGDERSRTPIFRNREGSAWSVGGRWLVADAAFSTVEAGLAIDDAFVQPLGNISPAEVLRLEQTIAPRYAPVVIDEWVLACNGSCNGAGYGKSLVRGADGVFVADAIPTIRNFAGDSRADTACYSEGADPLATRLLGFSPGCAIAQEGSSFVELYTSNGLPDATLRLQIRDHAGAQTADVGGLFTGHEHDNLTVGHAWLIGTTGFSLAAAYAADVELPISIDPVGGRVTLYHPATALHGTTIASDVAWGPGTSLPALPWMSGIVPGVGLSYTFAPNATPSNYSGSSLVSCWGDGTGTHAPYVSDLAPTCMNGDPGVRTIDMFEEHGQYCINGGDWYNCWPIEYPPSTTGRLVSRDVSGAPMDSVEWHYGEAGGLEGFSGYYFFGSPLAEALLHTSTFLPAPRIDPRGGRIEYSTLDSRNRALGVIRYHDVDPMNSIAPALPNAQRSNIILAKSCPPCGLTDLWTGIQRESRTVYAALVDTAYESDGVTLHVHADAASGIFALQAADAARAPSRMIQSDEFTLHGTPSGVEVPIVVTLVVHAAFGGTGTTPAYAPRAMLDVAGSGGCTLWHGYPGISGRPLDVFDTLRVAVRAVADVPFRVTTRLSLGEPRNSAPGSFDTQLSFANVPAGGALTNCRGYGSQVVPTAIAPQSANAFSDHVDVRWVGGQVGTMYTIERSEDEGPWTTLSTAVSDHNGTIILRDTNVHAGRDYGYRLRAGDLLPATETHTRIPLAPRFALSLDGAQPVRDALAVRCSVPGGRPAALSLFDVAGRRLGEWSIVPQDGVEQRRILLDGSALRSGLYLVRLRQGDRTIHMRALVVR